MEMIEVRTMNFYNKPSIYRHMPEEVFSTLEDAFLNDMEFVSIPKTLFEEMTDSIVNAELTGLSYQANTSLFSKN